MLCYITNDYQIPNCNVILTGHYLHIFKYRMDWFRLYYWRTKEIFWKPRIKVTKELNTSPIVVQKNDIFSK